MFFPPTAPLPALTYLRPPSRLTLPLPISTWLSELMRILVAEDDAPLAEFLNQRLQQERFTVQVVSDGEEAQRLASDQVYDLVILDLNLPGAAGLDVLQEIRSKKPDLPVVILTGSGMIEERVRGL